MTRPLPIHLVAGLALLAGACGSTAKPAPAKRPATTTKKVAAKTPPIMTRREFWATLVSMDGSRVVVRDAASDQLLTFRDASPTVFRFGVMDGGEEIKPGERLLVRTETISSSPSIQLSLCDAISEQLRLGQSYRMVSQDRDNYRFTVEGLKRDGQPTGERLTLEYGRPTFLVLRENPEYVFRVAEGTRLWINYGVGPDGKSLLAREVLDEASQVRFKKQQELRWLARVEKHGLPGRILEGTGGGRPITMFLSGPSAMPFNLRFTDGERALLRKPGQTEGGTPITVLHGGDTHLLLPPQLPGFKSQQLAVVVPQRNRVSFQRDIRPMLEVNCLPCHGNGRAQSGFTISDLGRMFTGGPRGKGVVPGKSGESLLYLTMTGERNPRMPPDRDAIPEQLELIKRWIDAGAVLDEAK